LAHSAGTSIEQVAAVAAPSPLAIAFAAGTAAISGAAQAGLPPLGPVQAHAAQAHAMRASAADAVAPSAPPAVALREVIDTVNLQLLTAGKSLKLSVDTQSGHSIVVVRDTQTGRVVQQLPGPELLRLASLLGTGPHLLIDHTV
jgi:uncharacterized FlaG/YvyC family protein